MFSSLFPEGTRLSEKYAYVIIYAFVIAIIIGVCRLIYKIVKYVNAPKPISYTGENRQAALIEQGKQGERLVLKQLSSLKNTEYIILNDLLLKTKYGTTQIDHVIVSIHGIFVLETKNYFGVISGCVAAPTLYQTIYGGPQKEIPNPLKQNITHVRTVRELFPSISPTKFHSFVVFGDKCEVEISGFAPRVCTYKNILHRIEDYRDDVFSKQEMLTMAEILRKANITNPEMRKQHIQNVQQYLQG